MIGKIEGKILDIETNKIIVSVGGVGFEINVVPETHIEHSVGQNVSMWTHMVVKEDSLSLYGFTNKEELNFFKVLINISGIGPKTAVNVLGTSSIKNLKSAVASGDIAYLTKISGIGKKIAEKIIFELKEKMSEYKDENSLVKGETDVLDALISLGYREKEIRDALKKIDKKHEKESEKIKEVLKILGK